MTVQSESRDLWIRRYHPAPDSAVRLLCLPHAGGSASFYFPVSQALAPRIEVLAVQYPGRQDRRLEPCVETIPELADRLLPLVVEEADRPLALFGHSMGASLAFELAGLLERRAGVVPSMLFASGRRAPSRFRAEEDIHRRGDEALLTEIRRLAGTDSRVLGDDEVLRMILPALRNDYRAAELYRPARVHQVACPVTALVGTEDPKAPLDDVHAWRDHTTGPFTTHTYPGGHFYLIDQAPRVIDLITELLTAVRPAAPAPPPRR
ncbi:thioesterase II family protein [Streptomyces sp. MB09-02B]|uniref:thioesterase II family protein n=1 Tax=Streptomyces sp. MB09-02B TaxID=3028667 RepID=UPI0029B7E33C|nr:alpha/beta fold hydrolase [Streptomyces sp. MB09-02B]MDX3645822.1 alpha/beta fold hydrolase [Streptomyces sp. MB09-02B]